MIDPIADPPAGPAKEPAPSLLGRAARPSAVRLRGGVVRAIVIGGVVLVSGSLAWAFVVQPEMRAEARARKAEGRDAAVRGEVRPAETVTGQPASYDRLPPPRLGPEAADGAETGPAGGPPEPSALYRAGHGDRTAERTPGPRPGDLALRSGLFFEPAGAPARQAQDGPRSRSGPSERGRGEVYNPHLLVDPISPFELKAGAIVQAALLTAVDTGREGPVVAMVTQNVFDSVTGRHLLLPQGSRLIGTAGGDGVYGDRRAFLTWERLILPNGRSLQLSEAGVDAQGAAGVRGQVDRRLLPLFTAVLASGAITTLGQMARRDGRATSSGWLGDAGDAVAIEGARVGGRLIDRELEVMPSIRLRAGAPVSVLITRDLILEPYRS